MIKLEHKTLLDAGVHFGHLTKKWNPKMAPFIFMKQNGIHVIDLNKTIYFMEKAAFQLKEMARAGKKILFVATKKQAKFSVEQVAKDLGMPYVTERWLGGTLTNFVTIRKLLKRMSSIEKNMHVASYKNLAKKEQLVIAREQGKLSRILHGLSNVTRLPSALLIIDINKEHIAVKEARKLGIPVFALADTNTNPDAVDCAIPGNDDSLRSIDIIMRYLSDAIKEGMEAYKKENAEILLKKEAQSTNSGPQISSRMGIKVVQGVVVKKKVSSILKATSLIEREKVTASPERSEVVKKVSLEVSAQDVSVLRKRTGSGMMDCKKALTEAKGDVEQAVDFLRKKGQKISLDRAGRNASEGAVFASVSSDNRESYLLVINCETDFVAKNELFLQLGKDILEVAETHKPISIEALHALPFGNGTVQEAIVASMGTIGEKITISTYETLRGDVVVSYIHTGNGLAVLLTLQGACGESVVAAGKDIAMQIAAMNPIALDKDQIGKDVVAREIAIIEEQVIAEGHVADKAEKITQGRLNKFFQENTLLAQPFVKNNKLTVAQYLKSIAPSLTVTSFKRVSVCT